MRDVAAYILLGFGLAVIAASCVAMAALRDPLDRLHVVTPASTLGVGGVCAAVVLYSGLNASGSAAILLGVVVFGTSPLLSHACARSIEVRRRAGGDTEPGPAS